jgi:hypothetical protein
VPSHPAPLLHHSPLLRHLSPLLHHPPPLRHLSSWQRPGRR